MQTIVIDQGQTLKAGFGGEDRPRYFLPSVIGRPKVSYSNLQDYYVGDEALIRKNILHLRYALEKGVVTEWDEMEMIWQYLFTYEFRIESGECRTIISEPPNNPKKCREKTLEIMFETFKVEQTYMGIQQLMALYSNAKTTGIIVDLGHDHSYVVNSYEGFIMPHATHRLDFGGRNVEEYLRKLVPPSMNIQDETIRNIKETDCFVKLDGSEKPNVDYELPDGNVISLGNELFECTEMYFNPRMIDMESHPIPYFVNSSIQNSKNRIRDEYYSNIFLIGGSSAFDGFVKRIEQEVSKLAPPSSTKNVKVIGSQNLTCDCWIGGSILTSLSSFETYFVTREEYESEGPSIVSRKCF